MTAPEPQGPASASSADRFGGDARIASGAGPADQYLGLIAAATALLAERGYTELAISDILSRAALPKASFYRFFEGTDACLLAAHEHYSDALLAAIDSVASPQLGWPQSLHRGVRAGLAFFARHPDAAQLLSMGILCCGPEGAVRYRASIEAIHARLSSAAPGASLRAVSVALTAGILAAPMLSPCPSDDDPNALDPLESDLVEIILTFTEAAA